MTIAYEDNVFLFLGLFNLILAVFFSSLKLTVTIFGEATQNELNNLGIRIFIFRIMNIQFNINKRYFILNQKINGIKKSCESNIR
jgi:hypothetical protein